MNSEEILAYIKESIATAGTCFIGLQDEAVRNNRLEGVNNALINTLSGYTNQLEVKSQFANKKDALWGGNSWYIPYVTETGYYEDGEIAYKFVPTWRSRREMSRYLKAHKSVVYSSFTCQLPGTVRSVNIKGTIDELS